MKTTGSKYHLLVLMDLSKSSEIVLKNAVELAKVIKGRVEVLHVKAPTDVIKHENQLSAMREIHEDYGDTKSKLVKIIRTVENQNDISISYKFAYGNIKNTIKEHIDKVKPEIVLLGKRKPKMINIPGTGITKFVLKNSLVNMFIVGEDNKFHSYTDISLGVYGEVLQQKGFEIINDLKQQNLNPIRLFKIRNQEDSKKNFTTEQKIVSYVFSEGENALDGLASYISRTNTQLLCIPQDIGYNTVKGGIDAFLKQVTQKINIPVLILR